MLPRGGRKLIWPGRIDPRNLIRVRIPTERPEAYAQRVTSSLLPKLSPLRWAKIRKNPHTRRIEAMGGMPQIGYLRGHSDGASCPPRPATNAISMKSIDERQQEILEEFGLLENWLDRYQQLIDLGQTLPAPAEDLHRDENLIRGCQSRVWIRCRAVDGALRFETDSDAVITKGIAALLIDVVNGHTPAEIAGADLYMVQRLGLEEHLSPTRANGLRAMLERIRECAQSYLENHA